MAFKNHIKGRVEDYDSINKSSEESNCIVCDRITYFKDEICSICRTEVPDHIPFQQVKRYVLRIKKGKQNA